MVGFSREPSLQDLVGKLIVNSLTKISPTRVYADDYYKVAREVGKLLNDRSPEIINTYAICTPKALGRVNISWGNHVAQWDVDQAIAFAMNVINAAMEAELMAKMKRTLEGRLKQPPEMVAALQHLFREKRDAGEAMSVGIVLDPENPDESRMTPAECREHALALMVAAGQGEAVYLLGKLFHDHRDQWHVDPNILEQFLDEIQRSPSEAEPELN